MPARRRLQETARQARRERKLQLTKQAVTEAVWLGDPLDDKFWEHVRDGNYCDHRS